MWVPSGLKEPLAREFAKRLSETNPNINEARFIEACLPRRRT